MTKRNNYSKEFKTEAIKMVLNEGKTTDEVGFRNIKIIALKVLLEMEINSSRKRNRKAFKRK